MPVLLFVWGASLLNADKSILKHQHQPTSTQTGLNEAGQRQHCAGLSLGTDSTAVESISSSFICLYASSVSGSSFVCFCCLFLMAGRERKVCLPLSLSLSLSQQLSIYSGQVVNPTTTKGTACKNGGEGILSVNLISSDYISGLTPSSCIPSVTKCKKARAQYIKTYSITHGSIKTSCYVLLKVNVNQADWLGKHSDLKATSQDSVCGRETPTYAQTCKWISVLLYRAMRW